MKKKAFIIVALHVLAWAVFLVLPGIDFDQQFNWNRFAMRNREMPLVIAYFYLNLYLIIPYTLEKKKILQFVLITLFCFTAFTLVQPAIDIYTFKHFITDGDFGPGFKDFRRRVLEHGYHVSMRGAFRNLSQLFVFFAISLSWRTYQGWRNEEKKRDQAQKEKLATELSLLKLQVSPHFLFNSLNSIYSLTVKKSDNASLAVVKLSELLRYMIYYAKKNVVNLSEELNYIENFIELQKLRLAEDITITFDVNVKNRSLEIEPMLLIPIIENAFKHGVSYKEPSEIIIRIDDDQDQLRLYTSNRVFSKKKDESSGFGIENLKKRLNLRYPDAYELKIEEQEANFIVDFSLNLKK